MKKIFLVLLISLVVLIVFFGLVFLVKYLNPTSVIIKNIPPFYR